MKEKQAKCSGDRKTKQNYQRDKRMRVNANNSTSKNIISKSSDYKSAIYNTENSE